MADAVAAGSRFGTSFFAMFRDHQGMVKGRRSPLFVRKLFAMRNNFTGLFIVLIAVGGLQYRLWVGDGSLAKVAQLQQTNCRSAGENQRCWSVTGCSTPKFGVEKGMETVEERARQRVGHGQRG